MGHRRIGTPPTPEHATPRLVAATGADGAPSSVAALELTPGVYGAGIACGHGHRDPAPTGPRYKDDSLRQLGPGLWRGVRLQVCPGITTAAGFLIDRIVGKWDTPTQEAAMAITIEDTKFERICETSLDSKGRVALAMVVRVLQEQYGSVEHVRFAVHYNHSGQILLLPETSIPLHEAWLYRNPTALRSVMIGIEQAKRGEVGPPLDLGQAGDE